MKIPPIIVKTSRKAWHWEWSTFMQALAPTDQEGSYIRPKSQYIKASPPSKKDLFKRTPKELPKLIIGRSCPWAHRTWLIYELRNLKETLSLELASVDKEGGRWLLNNSWLGCNTLLEVYKVCGSDPKNRATVPALIDPINEISKKPVLLGNESAQLVEALNHWPTSDDKKNFYPKEYKKDIDKWSSLLQSHLNDGVYRCGFARTQYAYEKASTELFNTLHILEESLDNNGPWLCGNEMTLADIRLFPTLIRWESIYAPLFKCSQEPLSSFPKVCSWRRRFYNTPGVASTCDDNAWRQDYYGALFPLNPSNIIPIGPKLDQTIHS